MSKGKNSKKKKVTYIDDGRTIADMSGVGKKRPEKKMDNLDRPKSDFKAQWNTYWSTVKMMLLPMLVVIGIICVAFGLMYILL